MAASAANFLRYSCPARPGLTGFWQVSGRNQLILEDRAQLEAWYVRNWTLWLDCIVFAKMFKVVLFPENGFRSDVAAGFDWMPHEDSRANGVPAELATKQGKEIHHAARV
jgi:Bacterial sugar transferase